MRAEFERTPLMNALRYSNDPKIVSLLIKKGAHVNDRDIFGENALMIRAQFVRFYEPNELDKASFKILLDAGSNLNFIQNNTNDTALSYLIENYTGTQIRDEILTMFLAHGANPNSGKVLRMSLLHYAREVLDNEDLAQRLIRAGAKE